MSPYAKAVASTHRNAHVAGLRDAAAMSIMAAEETVRVASKPVEAIVGHKVAQAADFDGYPLPACPASVGTLRVGVRMGYQIAGVLSAIPKGLFRGAIRLISSLEVDHGGKDQLRLLYSCTLGPKNSSKGRALCYKKHR